MKNKKKDKFTEKDALYPKAKKLALEKKNLTIADIQEKLRTGFVRSNGLMEMLKEDGVIKEENQKPPSSAKLKRLYRDIDWGKFKNKPVIPLGADTPTNNLIGNLENFFSLFVTGKRNSEREMFINSAMVNILKNTKSEGFRFLLIDTKKSSLKAYKNLPNLIFPLIEDVDEAMKAIDWCVAEVNRRFNLMIGKSDGFIDDYNKKFKKYKEPRILVVINDYADLTKKYSRRVKKAISEINVFGVLYGVHLFVCSSKITKENCPSRFKKAFHCVIFQANSSKELELISSNGKTETLKGKGDAVLKLPSEVQIKKIQSFTVTKEEIKKAIALVK